MNLGFEVITGRPTITKTGATACVIASPSTRGVGSSVESSNLIDHGWMMVGIPAKPRSRVAAGLLMYVDYSELPRCI